MLAEEGAEIADILYSAFHGDFTDRKICRTKKILGFRKTGQKNTFGSLVSGNSLYLSVELGTTDTHFRCQILTIHLSTGKGILKSGIKPIQKQSIRNRKCRLI